MDRLAAEEYARALAELESRKKLCPIAYFKPHPAQERALQSKYPITLIMAGNRFGKTHVNAAFVIASLLGYRPWEVAGFQLLKTKEGWSFPPRDAIPQHAWVLRRDGLPIACPSKILFVTGLPLERGIDIIADKFRELWPEQVPYRVYRGSAGVWKKLTLQNGSECHFCSAFQADLALEGFRADAAAVDEPIDRKTFIPIRRGLIDRKGQVILSMTPLGDANMAWIASDLLTKDRSDVLVIQGSSYDNPYLDKESFDSFFNDPTLTEEERRARLTGEIAALGRRIVTTFTDDCIVPATELPREIPRLMVVDPHHARPPFILWVAVMDEGERLVVYREWPPGDYFKGKTGGVTNHDLAGTIKSIEGKERVTWRICDPIFGRQHARVLGQQFDSFVEEMALYQLYFDTRVDNDLERGIAKLRDAFRVSPTIGRSRVQVMDCCPNLIKALKFWSYEEGAHGILKPSESFKDPVDCARYFTMYDIPIHIGQGTYNYLTGDGGWDHKENDA